MGLFDKIKKGFKKVGNGIADIGKDVGNGIADVGKDVGNGVADAAGVVADHVVDTAKETVDFAGSVGNFAIDAVTGLTNDCLVPMVRADFSKAVSKECLASAVNTGTLVWQVKEMVAKEALRHVPVVGPQLLGIVQQAENRLFSVVGLGGDGRPAVLRTARGDEFKVKLPPPPGHHVSLPDRFRGAAEAVVPPNTILLLWDNESVMPKGDPLALPGPGRFRLDEEGWRGKEVRGAAVIGYEGGPEGEGEGEGEEEGGLVAQRGMRRQSPGGRASRVVRWQIPAALVLLLVIALIKRRRASF